MEIELKRLVLGVQYDGSSWHGWQTQPSGETIQDMLENALHKFCKSEVKTTCAGRTDAGVHGLGQVVHFDTELNRNSYSWVNGVNAFLPGSIAVQWAKELVLNLDSDEHFHARFSASSRTYCYILLNSNIRSPVWQNKAGWFFRPLDLSQMQRAAEKLIGTHDFSAFRAAGCQAKSPIKLMHEIDIRQRGELIIFTLRASAFLHHMVRNIVGSLLFVGSGRRSVNWMEDLLKSRNRSLAAPTFMPDGLYLAKIDYDEKWQLPQRNLDQVMSILAL